MSEHVRARVVVAASIRRALVEQTSELTPAALQLISLVIGLFSQAFLAHMVDSGDNAALGAYEGHYAIFLLLGMALLDLQHAVVGGLSRSIREAQLHGSLESLIATPSPIALVLFALAVPEVLFAFGHLLLYALAGVLLFGLRLGGINFFGLAAVLMVSLLAFSTVALTGAALAMWLRRADPLNLFIAAASAIAGGVFYPRAILPRWLAIAGEVMPIAPALDALRAACVFHAGPFAPTVLHPLAHLAVFVLVVAPLGAWLFVLALSRARRDGSLTGF